MVDLKQLYKNLKDNVSTAEQDEERLNTDEEKEMKYLNREDIPGSLEIFSEEVDLAVDLTEHLENAEEDELQAEKLFKDSDVPEEIRERFMESEQEIEELVKKALEEMQTLKKEAEMLESQIQSSDVPQEAVEEFRSDRQELKQALNNMQEVEQEGKTMMERREFLAAAGVAGATAAGIGKITVENMHDFQKHMKNQQQEALKQINSSQQATKNESAKPNTDVTPGDGKIKEQAEVGDGLMLEAEIFRTSADSGFTVLNLHNTGNQDRTVDIKLSVNNWYFSGTMRFSSGNSTQVTREVTIPAGKHFSAGATLTKHNTSAGMIEYEVVTQSDSFRQVQLNLPASIISGQIVSPEKVDGLEIKQKLDPDTKYAEKELELEIKNTTGSKTVHSTLHVPSGWSFSATEDINQSSMGMVSTREQLGKGGSLGFDVHINEQDSNAPPVTTLSVVEVPDGNPRNASYYLVPVVLEE